MTYFQALRQIALTIRDTSMIAANHRLLLLPRQPSSSLHLAAKRLCRGSPMTSSNLQNRCFSTTSLKSSSGMDDEYGAMNSEGETFVLNEKFDLEFSSSEKNYLQNPQLRYMTYGTLNDNRDNVIVVCHALTGNASLHSWWNSLLGSNLAFDTDQYFIVCANILGSNYGSTSPQSINPETGVEYGIDFPDVTVRDTAKLIIKMLTNELNVRSVKSVIGGSFGGMQTLEIAYQALLENEDTKDNSVPFIRSFIPIASNAYHSAWQIGISQVQRKAIENDPNWKLGKFSEAHAGLSLARQIGMISYRTRSGYESKFGREVVENENQSSSAMKDWQVRNYLNYQGEKFLSRFDPVTYYKLTEQMDTHDINRNRNSALNQLASTNIPNLTLSIDSDVLYPMEEQWHLYTSLNTKNDSSLLSPHDMSDYPIDVNGANFRLVHSDAGHDGFLLEQDQVNRALCEFLNAIP